MIIVIIEADSPSNGQQIPTPPPLTQLENLSSCTQYQMHESILSDMISAIV
jgi:hypothetical protein